MALVQKHEMSVFYKILKKKGKMENKMNMPMHTSNFFHEVMLIKSSPSTCTVSPQDL